MSDLERVILELGTKLSLTQPANDHEIAAVAAVAGRSLPPELEAYYRRGGFASSIDQIDFFSRKDFGDVAVGRKVHPADHLSSAIYVASDGSDGWLFVDTDGSLSRGRGAGAVLWTDRAVRVPSRCVPCGASLAEFLAAVGAGRRPWTGPSLRALDLEEMKAALGARPERWHGGAAADLDDLWDAADRVGVRFPIEIDRLLEAADGMSIPAAGVTIHDHARLAPVEGTCDANGRPQAIWFAEDSRGGRYAVTTCDWREPDGGRVIRVGPGESAAAAPLLDSLPRVVVGWLEKQGV